MNIITAIKNEKIFKELKKKNNINIDFNNIQYKEGIIEILEKNKNIQYIIIDENLNGQIKIEELIKKVKRINNKINVIIILNNKDLIKEEYLLKNKINFIYKSELTVEKILEIIFNKNKIIGIFGNNGTGKTITTIILSEMLIEHKNKKVLIIEDNIINNSILKIYKEKNKQENNRENIIKIKNNLYLLNINKLTINFKKDKTKITNKINKIKNNYNYILIDTQNISSYKLYKDIINENILIINPNIFEINKIKNFIINNKLKIKLILNNYNENSISEEIFKNTFKNKIKVIGKIENNKRYNLIINNNLNIKYLEQKNEKEYLKIIKEI